MSALRMLLCVLAWLLGSFSVARPADNSSEEPLSENKNPRKDIYGDLLPDGAIARLGTIRFRYSSQGLAGICFSKDGRSLIAGRSGNIDFFNVETGRLTKR